MYTRGEEIGIDTREPAEDVVRILEGYHAVIAARVFDHGVLERMAAVADVPIVNLLSDRVAPVAGDRRRPDDGGRARLAEGPPRRLGRRLQQRRPLARRDLARCSAPTCALACPPGFAPDDAELERLALVGNGAVSLHHRPVEAVSGADVVHSDTWVSMGQDDEKAQRLQAFEGFTVDDALMAVGRARRRSSCTACPAYRGLEVAASVIDGPRSRVFRQGHNRLHAARGRARRILARGPTVSVKQRRQQAIVRLIGQHPVGNQPRLLELLAHEGVRTTQATVSRDLDELGVIKVRAAGGQTVYALPAIETDRIAPSEQLRRVLGEWVADVAVSGNIVVVRTPPGCAHVVASALDRSAHRRAARHGRRRRHADVRGAPRARTASASPPTCASWPGSTAGGRDERRRARCGTGASSGRRRTP